MKKLALILGLSISLSANAFEPIGPDDILTLTRPNGKMELLTFSELEETIEAENNLLFLWCENKSAIAGSILQDRGLMSREAITDELTQIQHKMRHYMWVELERIMSEVHRYKSNGDFEMAQAPSDVQYLTTKEYQKCLLNGF